MTKLSYLSLGHPQCYDEYFTGLSIICILVLCHTMQSEPTQVTDKYRTSEKACINWFMLYIVTSAKRTQSVIDSFDAWQYTLKQN